MQIKSIHETFLSNLPSNLYYSHYKLSELYEAFTPQEWRTYLRDNQTFIDSELAAIAEAEARDALSRLSNASGTEVQALKAILEKSKLINDAQKQSTKVVFSFIPPTNHIPQSYGQDEPNLEPIKHEPTPTEPEPAPYVYKPEDADYDPFA